MNCQGCSKNFNNGFNSPHLLPSCGHSVCMSCIKAKFALQQMVCPICGKISCAKNQTDFPKNIALLEVSEKKSNKAPIKSKFPLDIPSSIEFDLYLTADQQKLKQGSPKSCNENTKRRNSLSMAQYSNRMLTYNENHKTDFENCGESQFFLPAESFTDVEVDKHENCGKHNRPLEAFCFNDEKFLCLNCLIENQHVGHEIVDIDHAFMRAKSDIRAEISKLYQDQETKYRHMLEKSQEAQNLILENCHYSVRKVELFFAEVQNLILQKKQDLIFNLK